MHDDLLRRALESGKTQSRKARSKQASAVSSKAGSTASSRANSRAASSHGSDEDDDDNYSEAGWSTGSIDGLLSGDDGSGANWQDELSKRIDQILDRKRSNVQGRELDLMFYVQMLRARCAQDVISKRFPEIMAACLKSVKSEISEMEAVAALRAIQVSTVTDPNRDTYAPCAQPLKATISSSESSAVKTEAIYALGIVTFYTSSSEIAGIVMEFLHRIIESDGVSISADDDADAVNAALESWAFLATQLHDMEDSSAEVMDALVEQLDSVDPRVQISAGEAIALLYEKSYTDIESDDELSESEDTDDAVTARPTMLKRYDPYRRKDLLLHTLDTLANVSAKRISKKDRKTLHTNFADIRQSVEDPTLGPRYSSVLDPETFQRLGSRMTFKFGKTAMMSVDKWWKLLRLKTLRRVLQGGLLEHYRNNETFLDTLPVLAC